MVMQAFSVIIVLAIVMSLAAVRTSEGKTDP